MTPEMRGSSFEHYARTISPLHWGESLIAMLTVCFDGSGKDHGDHRIMVVAGFASFAKLWEDFTIKWNKRLQEDGLPYFHAKEFAHSKEVFADGWKGDELRRRKLSSDLMSIIWEFGLRKFGCILILKDFKHATAKRKNTDPNWPVIDAYAMAAMRAVESFHHYAKGEGITHNVRYVFEKGDPEHSLRKIFEGFGYLPPDFFWAKPHTDNKGFSYEPFVGLQAADWLAYEYFLDAQRILYSTHRDRWALSEFEKMPGGLVLTGESVRDHEAMARLAADAVERTMPAKVENVKHSLEILQKIKAIREGKQVIGGAE
jgi:hypothetical protein